MFRAILAVLLFASPAGAHDRVRGIGFWVKVKLKTEISVNISCSVLPSRATQKGGFP